MAVLFSALAPSISRALASSTAVRDSYLAEVCSAAGYKAVSISAGDTKRPAAPAGHGMEHCAFCATHGGSAGLPPPSSLPLAVMDGHDLYPSLFHAAPASAQPWTAAYPRAPPSNV